VRERLDGFGQLVPGMDGRRLHRERAGVQQPDTLLRLVRVREVAAENGEGREEHALLVHPHVRRV
jgi:hypothetical protein